ncbi:hypothetical protein ACLD9W_04350 [Neisseria sp. WLZKY-1]|uniref:hypothetical protein n=1 Tax=Neisseria sp. WLZKY-1 TaxID=3390377 RepID=UPI00397CB72A
MGGLAALKDLMLVRPSLRSLDGIEGMASLETLDISHPRSLTDVRALQTLLRCRPLKNISLPPKCYDLLEQEQA